MKLGGSTIAAACGLDPFLSPVRLWARMLGKIEDEAGEPAEWGNRLQPVIFEALRDRGVRVTPAPPGETLQDAAVPWLAGHPDGFTPRGIAEVKLTGRYSYEKDGALPLPWQAQVQTYMMLGRRESALVAVLVSGIRLETHMVYTDTKAQDLLLEMGADFMGYVEREQLPPVRADDAQTLAALFPSPEPAKVYRLTGDEWETAQELRRLRRLRDAYDEQVKELENRVKTFNPEAERLLGPHDEQVATWKPARRKAVDVKALREAQPSIAEEFTTETTSRRFTFHA